MSIASCKIELCPIKTSYLSIGLSICTIPYPAMSSMWGIRRGVNELADAS